MTIVVDVANVMGSRPDGWWRDRAGAAVRLYGEVVRLAASGRAVVPREADTPEDAGPPGDAVPPEDAGRAEDAGPPEDAGPAGFVLVLEGAARAAAARIASADAGAPDAEASGGPEPVRPGEVRVVLARGSGDDTIAGLAAELPGRRVVVTADRELRRRCLAAGATVVGPGWLLGLLRELDPGGIGPPGPFNRVAPFPSRSGARGRRSEHRSRQKAVTARVSRISVVWKILGTLDLLDV